MGDFDLPELLTATRDRVAAAVGNSQPVDSLLCALEEIRGQAENLLQRHDHGDRDLIACGPGCRTCCVMNVTLSLLEGLAIARHVRQMVPAGSQRIIQRLDLLWRTVRGLDDDERLLLRKDCAFLDECGRCGIYPVRPLVCRGVTSTDPQLCAQALAGEVFGEKCLILMHQFQQQVYETLFMGIVTGLEQAGLDGRSFQLTGLVRYLLAHPEQETELLWNKSLDWGKLYP